VSVALPDDVESLGRVTRKTGELRAAVGRERRRKRIRAIEYMGRANT